MTRKGWMAVVASISAIGCSGDAADGPASCAVEQRQGTYLMTFAEASGTCGPVPDGLVTFPAPSPDGGAGEGCQLLRPDQVTENGCKLDREIECITRVEDATVYGGYDVRRTKTTAVTRQKTSDASRIEGLMTIIIETSTRSCASTYNVTATRQ